MIVTTLPYRRTLNNFLYYGRRLLQDPETPPHIKVRTAALLEIAEQHAREFTEYQGLTTE